MREEKIDEGGCGDLKKPERIVVGGGEPEIRNERESWPRKKCLAKGGTIVFKSDEKGCEKRGENPL